MPAAPMAMSQASRSLVEVHLIPARSRRDRKMLGMCKAEHTAEEKVAALGSMTVTIR